MLQAQLYFIAHQLVEAWPHRAVAWFAVGCYYSLVNRQDAAQRHFMKATKLDPRYAPAWIGFGHAYAAQDESESAMVMYRTASRLFPGSHLPFLFMGMEYLRSHPSLPLLLVPPLAVRRSLLTPLLASLVIYLTPGHVSDMAGPTTCGCPGACCCTLR